MKGMPQIAQRVQHKLIMRWHYNTIRWKHNFGTTGFRDRRVSTGGRLSTPTILRGQISWPCLSRIQFPSAKARYGLPVPVPVPVPEDRRVEVILGQVDGRNYRGRLSRNSVYVGATTLSSTARASPSSRLILRHRSGCRFHLYLSMLIPSRSQGCRMPLLTVSVQYRLCQYIVLHRYHR